MSCSWLSLSSSSGWACCISSRPSQRQVPWSAWCSRSLWTCVTSWRSWGWRCWLLLPRSMLCFTIPPAMPMLTLTLLTMTMTTATAMVVAATIPSEGRDRRCSSCSRCCCWATSTDLFLLGEYVALLQVLFVSSMMLTLIILLNLLIALMSDSYERIQVLPGLLLLPSSHFPVVLWCCCVCV
jgi:hypothetical protein